MGQRESPGSGAGGGAGLLAATLALSGAAGAAGKKSAQFEVTAVRSGPNVSVTTNSKVWITQTQARADVKNPLAGEVRLIVANGAFYQVDPKGKRYVKQPLPPEMRKSADNFDLLFGKFAFDASKGLKSAKKVRSETVSGYECDVFENTATQGDQTNTLTVWVAQKLSPPLPLKLEAKGKLDKPGASMSESYTITLSNVKVGEDIPAGVFAIPAGYKQVQPQQGAKPGGKPAGGRKPGKGK